MQENKRGQNVGQGSVNKHDGRNSNEAIERDFKI